MAEVINTGDITPKSELCDLDRLQIYCGLDSCVTQEVLSVISDQLDEETSIIYDFERALQARKERIQYVIDQLAGAVWSGNLNAGSYQQLKAFFYDYMGLPAQYKFEKGKRKVTVNRDALEKLCYYRYARPIAKAILAHRDMVKRIAVLRSGIDPDGRMRFSYNIGGTNTGRFSCNENVFGGGTNANNITDELRRIFIAPNGRKLAYLDLEQAESRVVAYRSGDPKYISACESSDLHVYVAKLVWPELAWHDRPGVRTNRSPADHDKEISERKYYRHFSYRDLSKRGGHLTNYLGQPDSNAKQLQVSKEIMRGFHHSYLDEFSGIRRWHTETKAKIVTSLGRKRLFFGRTWDDTNLRKAIAYDPQSTIGDLLNLGMWRVWKHIPKVDLLTQLYDAILVEYDEEDEDEVIPAMVDLMSIPVPVTDTKLKNSETRTMLIPVDASVGWNWGKFHADKNPDGLCKYRGPETRKRRIEPNQDIMTRPL
ncbi:MAG: DNA polymerase [Candidatus Thorarchaeota archaeon]|jgi:DNA polymerase I-like protein with 3'-5' exonuclease and polymerase domains